MNNFIIKLWIVTKCMCNKNLLIILAFVMTILPMNGCSENNKPIQEERDAGMESVEMTNQEMQFLKDIYMDENRIAAGYLYSYQQKTLLQYRFALKYLNEKYPSYRFKIFRGEPMNAVNSYARFSFKETNKDSVFELHIMQEEESFKGEDNFYGEIIREKYDDYLYGQCISDIGSLIGTYSIISGVKGIEYDETLSMEDIVDGSKPISPLTEMYISGNEIPEDEWNDVALSLEEIVKIKGLYGAYIVYFLASNHGNNSNGESCHSYLEGSNYLYKYSFQNFNR